MTLSRNCLKSFFPESDKGKIAFKMATTTWWTPLPGACWCRPRCCWTRPAPCRRTQSASYLQTFSLEQTNVTLVQCPGAYCDAAAMTLQRLQRSVNSLKVKTFLAYIHYVQLNSAVVQRENCRLQTAFFRWFSLSLSRSNELQLQIQSCRLQTQSHRLSLMSRPSCVE